MSSRTKCRAKCRARNGMGSVPIARGKGTWLTATPDFACGVNLRQVLNWKNARFLRAQVTTKRESLLTTPNLKPHGDLRPSEASNERNSLLTRCSANNQVQRGLRDAEIAVDAETKQDAC